MYECPILTTLLSLTVRDCRTAVAFESLNFETPSQSAIWPVAEQSWKQPPMTGGWNGSETVKIDSVAWKRKLSVFGVVHGTSVTVFSFESNASDERGWLSITISDWGSYT